MKRLMALLVLVAVVGAVVAVLRREGDDEFLEEELD